LRPFVFFFQAEDGIRDFHVTGVQTCALPIYKLSPEPLRLIDFKNCFGIIKSVSTLARSTGATIPCSTVYFYIVFIPKECHHFKSTLTPSLLKRRTSSFPDRRTQAHLEKLRTSTKQP